MICDISLAPIGVLDSGVGGVHILNQLKIAMPYEDFVYFADNKNMPYGRKTKKALIRILLKNVEYLIANYQIKMLVLACNTATSVALGVLRQKFSIPIIGTSPVDIEPPIGAVLLATKLTCKNIAPNYLVHVEPATLLAEKIENAIKDKAKLKAIIKKYFMQYLGKCVVLGCTHYQLIKEQIMSCIGDITLIDPSVVIVDKCIENLNKSGINALQARNRGITICLTQDDVYKRNIIEYLINS